MADRQDMYFLQQVQEDEMDTIYDDMETMETSLSQGIGLAQGTDPAKYGGITSGLNVTKVVANQVNVTVGVCRNGDGQRIQLPSSAVVQLTNLGDTPEGDYANPVGNGPAIDSSYIPGGNEAWLSLFIVYDTNLSDSRIDGLGNPIDYRQTESFHFRLELGASGASGSASARASLATNKVLLADILLDDTFSIRTIGSKEAIMYSSADFNEIGYGLDDIPVMKGRRSDWLVIDSDGTDFDLWKDALDISKANSKAYLNIRAGDAREAIRQLLLRLTEVGSSTKYGGSDIINGHPVGGKVLSAPGSAVALQMPSGSIHTQLEALYDKVNTLLSRGADTITGVLNINGNPIINGNLAVNGNITISTIGILNAFGTTNLRNAVIGPFTTGDVLHVRSAYNLDNTKNLLKIETTDSTNGDLLRIKKHALLEYGHMFLEDFHYITTISSTTLDDHIPKQRWTDQVSATGDGSYQVTAGGNERVFKISLNPTAGPTFYGILGPDLFRPDLDPNIIMQIHTRSIALAGDHYIEIGIVEASPGINFFGIVIKPTGVYVRVRNGAGGTVDGVVNLGSAPGAYQSFTAMMINATAVEARGNALQDTASLASGAFNANFYRPRAIIHYSGGGTATGTDLELKRFHVIDKRITPGY